MDNLLNQAIVCLERALIEIENGFVACDRCGVQEETKNLDFVDDIKSAKDLLIAESYKQNNRPKQCFEGGDPKTCECPDHGRTLVDYQG